jgi:ubiquinol-cytochrome c reductase cytochrome b subunit
MFRRLAAWIDDRIGGSAFAESALSKIFPDHWSFMLGEVALYSFVVLVVTGVFLTFFFDPSVAETTYQGSYEPLQGATVSEAYRSVVELSFDVRAGLVMRQAHHWAAFAFIGALVLHVLRVFFTGAFRRPREINWVIGVTLLALALFNGFTGYSLPDDLLSGTGLRIAYSIALSVPVIGTWAAFLVFGGEFPAQEIIPRLFVTHIMIVPAAIAVLFSVHLALIWHQKHTDFAVGAARRESNVVGPKLWTTYATFSVALFFAVFAVIMAMGGLIQINPVWLYGPFRPSEVPSPAQPDWFLGWAEGALRIFPPWEIRAFGYEIPNPFYPGVLVPTVLFAALYVWPFLEARFTGDREPHHLLDRARDHPVRTAFGVTALSFFVLLELAASNDLMAHWFDASVATISWFFRIAVPIVPLLLGWSTYRLMVALRASAAERFAEMPLRAVWRPAGDGEQRAAVEPVGKPAAEAAAAASAMDGAELTVYPDPDGRWRWSYRHPADEVELHSNKSYVTEELAEQSARQAYPETPLVRST